LRVHGQNGQCTGKANESERDARAVKPGRFAIRIPSNIPDIAPIPHTPILSLRRGETADLRLIVKFGQGKDTRHFPLAGRLPISHTHSLGWGRKETTR